MKKNENILFSGGIGTTAFPSQLGVGKSTQACQKHELCVPVPNTNSEQYKRGQQEGQETSREIRGEEGVNTLKNRRKPGLHCRWNEWVLTNEGHKQLVTDYRCCASTTSQKWKCKIYRLRTKATITWHVGNKSRDAVMECFKMLLGPGDIRWVLFIIAILEETGLISHVPNNYNLLWMVETYPQPLVWEMWEILDYCRSSIGTTREEPAITDGQDWWAWKYGLLARGSDFNAIGHLNMKQGVLWCLLVKSCYCNVYLLIVISSQLPAKNRSYDQVLTFCFKLSPPHWSHCLLPIDNIFMPINSLAHLL